MHAQGPSLGLRGRRSASSARVGLRTPVPSAPTSVLLNIPDARTRQMPPELTNKGCCWKGSGSASVQRQLCVTTAGPFAEKLEPRAAEHSLRRRHQERWEAHHRDHRLARRNRLRYSRRPVPPADGATVKGDEDPHACKASGTGRRGWRAPPIRRIRGRADRSGSSGRAGIPPVGRPGPA